MNYHFRNLPSMRGVTIIAAFATVILAGCTGSGTEYTAITGGTLLDLSENGTSAADIENAVILFSNGHIVDAGPADRLKVPKGAKIVDASGRFIMPGLIDGFAAINNQAYANAYLYKGITSIITVSGGRRGDLFTEADPGPRLYNLNDVGREELSDDELAELVAQRIEEGNEVLLLMYRLTPDQLVQVVQMAEMMDVATIGELGFSSYSFAIDARVNAFVHSTRYSLDFAPAELREAVALEPFSDEMQSPKWKYYNYLTEVSQDDGALRSHASRLGSGGTYLMPTLSLMYLDLPGHKNPWEDPVATIIDASDINNPANPETGNHEYTAEIQEAYTKLIQNVLETEKINYASGAAYLAGSATDVWGTMPGFSLHTELELLTGIGLTNREALAAATTNFVTAFGFDDTGVLVAGRRADILILDRNPLDDLANLDSISRMFLEGVEINREDLLEK